MRVTNVFLALMASATVAIAAPASEAGNRTVSARWTCPSKWQYCGNCNGTSCNIGGVNYRCGKGSCVGPGGGDTEICGTNYVGFDTPAECPGKARLWLGYLST